MFRRNSFPIALAAVVCGLVGPRTATAADLYKPFKALVAPIQAAQREKPVTGEDDSIEQLAKEIDWLEHYIDTYGSIVAKHPDVWGESRLMRHRYEYENQMAAQLGEFEFHMNAALRRSDQAFLGMAFALQNAAASAKGASDTGDSADADPDAGDASEATQESVVFSSLTNLNVDLPSTNEPASDNDEGAQVIFRNEPFAKVQDPPTPGFTYENDKLSLEPTIHLDQMSRYLNHLHELRRINEGDDVADSPGYSLNLVRIPVSVLPGKQTQTGYGAEITIIAEPYLGDDLLPSTFRNLVINDLVDMLAPVVTNLANNEDIRSRINQIGLLQAAAAVEEAAKKAAEAAAAEEAAQEAAAEEADQEAAAQETTVEETTVEETADEGNINNTSTTNNGRPRYMDIPAGMSTLKTGIAVLRRHTKQDGDGKDSANGSRIYASTPNNLSTDKIVEEAITELEKVIGYYHPLSVMSHTTASGINSRRARLPVPLSQVPELLGPEPLQDIVLDVIDRLATHPASNPTISYVDVRAYLHEELEASYDFLKRNQCEELWCFCVGVADAVRDRRMKWLDNNRNNFFKQIGDDDDRYLKMLKECLDNSAASTKLGTCKKSDDNHPICQTITARLAWMILVESALLDQRLREDMEEAASAKGCGCMVDCCGPFYGPHQPGDMECLAFNEYVRCRWPVRVFALDPVTQDQNVADAYARRREMQVAVALAFASGRMDAQALMRYTQRLEWDMATIDLNRTVVGFSHGNDTFGWRFQPRFQTPPVKGSLATFAETLLGGPTTDSDLAKRQIEPGIRECTAIVVMPSFVPYVTFDVRTNWYKLTNPKRTEISMQDTMVLSRSIKAMQQSAAMCAQYAHLYRDGEVHRLLRRVDQLDRELPLQTMQTQIPYENTSGGFELFNTGITDLAPELIGWYGAPGIHRSGSTTLYLIGKGFSIHSTQLIAGGRNVPYRLISRQILEAEIPAGAMMVKSRDGKKDLVDVHMATPYGVSSHLLVPVADDDQTTIEANELAWENGLSLTMTAVVTPPKAGQNATADANQYFNSSSPDLSIFVPTALAIPDPITLVITLRDEAGGTFVGSITKGSGISYDARNNKFYITGNDLNALVRGNEHSLRSLIERYLIVQLSNNPKPKKILELELKAELEPGNNRPRIPIENSVRVTVNVVTTPEDPPAVN